MTTVDTTSRMERSGKYQLLKLKESPKDEELSLSDHELLKLDDELLNPDDFRHLLTSSDRTSKIKS